MITANDSPGAVILGGGFASLEAARNLSKHGVRVCVLGCATSVVRFSRSVSRFITCSSEETDEEILDCLLKMAEDRLVQGWVLLPTSDDHLRLVAQHRSILAKHYTLI